MTQIIILIIGIAIGFLIGKRFSGGGESAIAERNKKQIQEKENRKEKILAILREQGKITNNNVQSALGVGDSTATKYLQELENENKIIQIGEQGHAVHYRLKD